LVYKAKPYTGAARIQRDQKSEMQSIVSIQERTRTSPPVAGVQSTQRLSEHAETYKTLQA